MRKYGLLLTVAGILLAGFNFFQQAVSIPPELETMPKWRILSELR